MSSTGNAIHGNILTAGLVTATGNVTGGNILTAGLISATSTITSAANIIGGNITTVGLITATGNVTGGNILTAGVMSSSGNAIHGNITTVGLISATGNVTGNFFIGNGSALTGIVSTTAATVTTNAQPNITSVGTLTSLTSSGLISTTGNISGSFFIGNGSQLTGVVAGSSPNISNGTSNVSITTSGGNVTVGVAGTANVFTVASTGILLPGNISAAGNIVAGGVRSTSSASPPANPTTGDFWYNTTTNVQFRFTFDGTNYYWIDDFGAYTATQAVAVGPVLFNDVSTQTSGRKTVFPLKTNQTAVTGIANSKQLQVIVNGAYQTPYVTVSPWPFWCIDNSFNGFKVVKLGYSLTANSVVLYRPPAKRSQVSITQLNTAQDTQIQRYPFSATTIAISDD
jgi:hypothetical protein